MSEYFLKRYKDLAPYTPGEQPGDGEFIKLNTNESPYPPSPGVAAALKAFNAGKLRLYPEPSCRKLREKIAEAESVSPENVMVTNGSDDVLNYFFMAYGKRKAKDDDDEPGIRFPDITYSFYKVLADLHGIRYEEVPLAGDFTISPEDYDGGSTPVVIANPNAPTGLMLTPEDVEHIVSHAAGPVLIDEAYVDFGCQTAAPLIKDHPNLVVSRTLSKSGSFAGGRLGYALAPEELINDMESIRCSMSPYSVDAVTQVLAEAAFDDPEYYRSCCDKIMETRRFTRLALSDMGFRVIPSMTNFLFVKHPDIGGKDLYEELKRRMILVRHFDGERIREYNRITIGSREDMEVLIANLKEMLE